MKLGLPKKLVLELSRNCNLACQMCGFGGNAYSPAYDMPISHLETLLSHPLFQELKEIRLNGRGESTIHPDFPEMVHLTRTLFPKVNISLFTNLMFPNISLIELFAQEHLQIFVSLDSMNAQKLSNLRSGTSLTQIKSHIQQITKQDIDCYLVFTLTETNLQDVLRVAQYATDQGIGFLLNILRVNSPTKKTEFSRFLDNKWDTLLDMLTAIRTSGEKRGIPVLIPDQIWGRLIPRNISNTITCGNIPVCPNTVSEIMIHYDGIISPCNMFHPQKYGSLEEGLEKVWMGEKHVQFIQDHKQYPYCKHCQYMIPQEATNK